ncbi:MFS transporter [Isoptericola halotolerans]|uniref:OHS family lactose permease-like MFS transporter n=1 Tax=Isoptericola halotolerans TaxID=300560 RepID=A0ABX2A2K1_9MICO|nr:oligosaccharide MFS transporter [Isoptericola halotolerans]NOV95987.1 OHS family lactose permease-like MFS transporter [Isoptericola halotolerans]
MTVQHEPHHPPSAPTGAVTPRARDSLRKPAFWNIGGLFFFYFAIWQLVFTFLGPWLEDQAGMTSGNIGLLNSVMALTALCLQPFYGFIQDRLGFRKNLFAFVVVVGAFMGPFFAFVFVPIVELNQVLGAVVGGIYLSLVLNSGVGVVEAFNERTSRANRFEYGHVRLFGSVAGATASLVGGFIWAANPDNVWWVGTFSAVVLGVLLFVVRTPRPGEKGNAAAGDDGASAEDRTGDEDRPRVTKETVLRLFRDRSFVGFMVLMFGTVALYDVFDQQYAIYFGNLFDGVGDPQVFFSRVVFVQILLEAIVMVAMPFVINKIGAKRGLQLFAVVLVVRVVGSALFTSTELLVVWRLLAALEMPLMLVSVWKYITRMFDVRISATAYMIGFNTAKQIGIVVFSWVFGLSYDAIGFGSTYLIMGVVVVAVTAVASVLMRDDRGRVAPGAGDLTRAAP